MISEDGPERTEVVLGLRCPSCHLLLSVEAGAGKPGYACVGGHTFTPGTLLRSDDGSLRRAVEQALSVWEERAAILRTMAHPAAKCTPEELASCLDREAGGLEARLAVLRETLA